MLQWKSVGEPKKKSLHRECILGGIMCKQNIDLFQNK